MSLANINYVCINALSENSQVLTPIDRRPFVVPVTNQIGTSRLINPNTMDYEIVDNKIAGNTGVNQQIYLSLVTVLGSAAQINMGQNLNNIQVILPSIVSDVESLITLALSQLVTNNQILINNISVQNLTATGVQISVSITDLTVPINPSNALNYGANPVTAPILSYPCQILDQIMPDQIDTVVAWYRADQGVYAPNNQASIWRNESGFERDVFDSGQDSYSVNPPFLMFSDSLIDFNMDIAFTGSQYLQTGIWNDVFLASPITVFCIGYWQDNSGTYTAFDGYGFNELSLTNNNGTLQISNGTTQSAGSASLGPQAYIIVFNGTSSYIKQSTYVANFVSGNTGSDIIQGITLGNNQSFNQGGFTMSELAVFEGQVSTYQQDLLLNYAHNRYEIQVI